MAIAADRISTKLFIQHPTAFDIKIVGILEQLAPGQSTHGRKIALVRAASTFNLNKRAYLSNISIFRFYMERWGQLYSQYLRQRDDVLSGHKLNQKVHFQAQRLSIPKTTCRSIAFRLVPVRFSVSLAVLFFFFFFLNFISITMLIYYRFTSVAIMKQVVFGSRERSMKIWLTSRQSLIILSKPMDTS